jgi:hypothetical protein
MRYRGLIAFALVVAALVAVWLLRPVGAQSIGKVP